MELHHVLPTFKNNMILIENTTTCIMPLKIVHHTKLLKTYYYVTEKVIAGFTLKLIRLTQTLPRSIINAT